MNYSSFQSFNQHSITIEGFFDFSLMSHVSVYGLSNYFQKIENSIHLSKKEISLYQKGKGITIRKLESHLSQRHIPLMSFLLK